jgi:CheY-like chemotaxis protein
LPRREIAQVPLHILIADSDPWVRSLAVEVIEKLGYTALSARDGEEALEVACKCGCDITLLLTSVALPRMNGLELAARLRERVPALKVIYMSATQDPVRVNAPIHPGSVPLPKPFTCEQLGFELGALIGEIERQQATIRK